MVKFYRGECLGSPHNGYGDGNDVFSFSRLSKTTKLQGTTESQLSFINFLARNRLLAGRIVKLLFHGELSTSQKEVITAFIEKKDRDRRLIKIWRPISLVNVDVKTGSRAIAKRLEKVLPYVVHHDQNPFVKGTTIFDAVRTISDSMDYTEMKGYEGQMSVIDFEKAFDSLSLDFLFKSLELFGFGVFIS